MNSKLQIFTIAVIFSITTTYAQNKPVLADYLNGFAAEKPFDDIKPALNSDFFYKLEKNTIYKFHFSEPLKPISKIKLDSIKLLFGEFEDFAINANESKVLLYFNSQKRFRHSFRARYVVFDVNSGNTTIIADTARIMNAQFSPDGNKIAWVKDNDLFYQDLASNKTVRVTYDGKEGEIINGVPDWVYEEEFSLTEAFSWSGDSKMLAYLKFDERAVPSIPLMYFGSSGHPKIKNIKYPRPGENISDVQVLVYTIGSKKNTLIAKTDKSTKDYIPRFGWTGNNNEISYVTLNRLHNRLQIFSGNTTGKAIKLLYEETCNTFFDELPKSYPVFLKNENSFIFLSEQSGYRHLYLKNCNSRQIMAITEGESDIGELLFFDTTKDRVYYSSYKHGALHSTVQWADLKNGQTGNLGPELGTNEATFSSSGNYCIVNCSQAQKPNMSLLYMHNGQLPDTLENNEELIKKIIKANIPLKEFFSFSTYDGTMLNAWIIKPSDFDSTRKYPVLQYVYGGPGVQTVRDTWQINWFNYLASQGFIVVSTDNRGTPGRGNAFRQNIYGNLGTCETADQISFATYLAKLPFIDSTRIGIYGWSYGGYIAAMCMLKGADIFKAGIAVAPVTDWQLYDAVYTERYMGLPAENASGYNSSSLLNKAHLLSGKLLLVHGSSDDNVHVQHTMAFSEALIAAGKQFDMAIYPNKDHSIRGGNTRLHLFEKMLGFLKQNF